MSNISLSRKKELNEPDEFINFSNQVLQYVNENRTLVMSVVVAVVAFILIVSGYLIYSDVNEKKAFTQLSSDLNWYETLKNDTEKTPALNDIKTRSDEFFKSYSGTVAAKIGMSRYAEIFYAEGDVKSAVELYEKLLNANLDTSVENLILCALGQAHEALSQADEAIGCFEKVLSSDVQLNKDTALFHLALLYEKQEKNDKSQEYYKRIVADYSDSVYYKVAKEKSVPR